MKFVEWCASFALIAIGLFFIVLTGFIVGLAGS